MSDRGWLARSLASARAEVATWPEWKRRAMRVTAEEGVMGECTAGRFGGMDCAEARRVMGGTAPECTVCRLTRERDEAMAKSVNLGRELDAMRGTSAEHHRRWMAAARERDEARERYAALCIGDPHSGDAYVDPSPAGVTLALRDELAKARAEVERLREAARAVLRGHHCNRCGRPDIRPDYDPECVLRRVVEGRATDPEARGE